MIKQLIQRLISWYRFNFVSLPKNQWIKQGSYHYNEDKGFTNSIYDVNCDELYGFDMDGNVIPISFNCPNTPYIESDIDFYIKDNKLYDVKNNNVYNVGLNGEIKIYR